MPILRPCSGPLALALEGGVELWSADLFQFDLVDGATTFLWTSWNKDLVAGGNTYLSKMPWLNRSKWNVSNTMEVPTLMVYLRALNDGFNGGANIKTQIHNGLFDGAKFLLSRAYMVHPNETATLGTIDLFGGEVAGLDMIGTVANINIKGKVNTLDQYVPRNVIQIGCNHAFCDIGCTLSRGTFTTAYVMGSGGLTRTFIPWSGSPPGNATNYLGGSVHVTSGAASGAWRTIVEADATGLTLSYPLYDDPAGGDGFTAFEGCDKTFNSGTGRSCTDRFNTQNYRGFEFVPPPSTAI